MEIKCLRTLAKKIFKTLNDIDPNYIKEIFHLSPHETHNKYDMFVHSRNKKNYENHYLSVLGPHICKSLPEEIKHLFSLNGFKNFIKG